MIGEALSLKWRHVAVPQRPHDPLQVVLLLERTKRGFDERVVLTDPETVLICWFITISVGERTIMSCHPR